MGGPDGVELMSGAVLAKLCGGGLLGVADPNKLRCCIIERFNSCDGIIGDVGEEAAVYAQFVKIN